MKADTSPLFSRYILEGVQMEQTPFEALYDCLDGNGTVDVPKGPFADIVDEYLDRTPGTCLVEPPPPDACTARILRMPPRDKNVDLFYPVSWTLAAIDGLLLDVLFRDGHFTLGDILLIAKWDWDCRPVGNMAAFHDSTVAAGRHLFDLGVRLDRYFVETNRSGCFLELTLRSRMSARRKCPRTMLLSPSDWIIYIPFGISRLNLGGSAYAKVAGCDGGADTDLSDADYFIDCYEIARELVEDGVVVAGLPVGRGGLMTAAEKFRGGKALDISVGGIMSARGESEILKILFAEMPGILVQIKDEDYDYLDSQMLLQDIAYFPLGHPGTSSGRLSVTTDDNGSVSGILASLLSQATEGED